MMPGPVAGSVEILAELKTLGTRLYCLTNFSAETYPPTFERFEFLRWFRGVLVSGEVGVIKPDPRIFELLLERFAIDPKRAVYIDDVAANVDAARPFGDAFPGIPLAGIEGDVAKEHLRAGLAIVPRDLFHVFGGALGALRARIHSGTNCAWLTW